MSFACRVRSLFRALGFHFYCKPCRHCGSCEFHSAPCVNLRWRLYEGEDA